MGKQLKQCQTLFSWAPKSLQMVTVAMKLKDSCSLEEKLWPTKFSWVSQSCLTICDPMNRSTPGLPFHHQLPESTQTHVHCVSDAIQPSHPLSSPSPPALNLSQHWVFSNESALCIRWPTYWSFSFNISPSNEHPGLISFRMDWLDLSRVFFNTTVQKHPFFNAQLGL